MQIKKLNFFFTIAAVLMLAGAGCVSSKSSAPSPVGMFRSTDKGEEWVQINALPTAKGVESLAAMRVYKVFTDPSDANALYAATRGQGLYYSYNNGESWRSANTPLLNNKFIYGVAVDPKFKCTVYVTDGPNVYKTVDCLRTWETVYAEQRPTDRLTALVIDQNNNNTLYAALIGGDVIVSIDGGRNWRAVKRFTSALCDLALDPRVPGRIYVATQYVGLHRSDDGGATWVDMNKGLKNFSNSMTFYRLAAHPSKKNSLFWISKYGILRSDDGGENWTEIKLITAPGSVNIYAFAVNGANDKEMYYAGTTLGENNTPVRSTFYKSTDGGVTWVTKKLPTNTIPVSLTIHPEQTNVLFLGFALLE